MDKKTEEVKTDEVKAEEKVVEETTQDSSPESEAPATQEQTDLEESQVSDELPEDSEEQRRAFQSMRQELKRLKEEKGARAKSESAFDVFRPKTEPQPQVGPIRVEDYQDPYSGEVDWNRYNGAVNNAIAQTQQTARSEAQRTTEELIDENTARSKYPEVFEDSDLEEEAAARWLFDRMNGKNTPLTKIAKNISDKVSKAVTKAEKIGAEKILEEVTPKEQAALAAAGETSAGSRQTLSDDEFEKLQRQSRGKGRLSEEAIATRLKGVPWR
jgi:hypothetical protein